MANRRSRRAVRSLRPEAARAARPFDRQIPVFITTREREGHEQTSIQADATAAGHGAAGGAAGTGCGAGGDRQGESARSARGRTGTPGPAAAVDPAATAVADRHHPAAGHRGAGRAGGGARGTCRTGRQAADPGHHDHDRGQSGDRVLLRRLHQAGCDDHRYQRRPHRRRLVGPPVLRARHHSGRRCQRRRRRSVHRFPRAVLPVLAQRRPRHRRRRQAQGLRGDGLLRRWQQCPGRQRDRHQYLCGHPAPRPT